MDARKFLKQENEIKAQRDSVFSGNRSLSNHDMEFSEEDMIVFAEGYLEYKLNLDKSPSSNRQILLNCKNQIGRNNEIIFNLAKENKKLFSSVVKIIEGLPEEKKDIYKKQLAPNSWKELELQKKLQR